VCVCVPENQPLKRPAFLLLLLYVMLCVFRFAPRSLFELCFYSQRFTFIYMARRVSAAASLPLPLSCRLFAILLLGRSVT